MIDCQAESRIFKALSEPTRLKILDMLSCGEMCARNMLDSLSIMQSTLSHHMKVLMECGLVSGRKDATWMYYAIRPERVEMLHQFLEFLTHPKEGCILAQDFVTGAVLSGTAPCTAMVFVWSNLHMERG